MAPRDRADVDLVFPTRTIRVTYDRPRVVGGALRLFGGWGPLRATTLALPSRTFYRRVRRTFVLRALPLRQILLVQETMAALRASNKGELDYPEACAVIVGIEALWLPRAALITIFNTYMEINNQTPATSSGKTVTISSVMRRLEREPFLLTREQIEDMTLEQIEARLAEFGEDEIDRLKAEAQAHSTAAGT